VQIDLIPDEVELLVRALDVLSAEAALRGYGPVKEQAEDLTEKLRKRAWEQRPGAPPSGGQALGARRGAGDNAPVALAVPELAMGPRLSLPLSAALALALAPAAPAPPLPGGKPGGGPPATEEARPAASPDERESLRNLERLSRAMSAYHDARGRYPADVTDRRGRALLSWRVLLLPHLGERALYRRFKLDEPWDGKSNRELLEKMPKVFASPRVALKRKGYTVYQGISGEGACFRPGKPGLRVGLDFPDGASRTLMVVEASAAVPWSKPADVPFDPKRGLPELGKAFGQRPLALTADGGARAGPQEAHQADAQGGRHHGRRGGAGQRLVIAPPLADVAGVLRVDPAVALDIADLRSDRRWSDIRAHSADEQLADPAVPGDLDVAAPGRSRSAASTARRSRSRTW